jgi:hypothetical protein
MRPSPEKHIDIHMPCRYQQAVRIARWDYRMAVREADAERAMGDDLGEW